MARGKKTKVVDLTSDEEDSPIPSAQPGLESSKTRVVVPDNSDELPAPIPAKRPRTDSGAISIESDEQDSAGPSLHKKNRRGETVQDSSHPVLTLEQINLLKSKVDPDSIHSLMVKLMANALKGAEPDHPINSANSIRVSTFVAIGPEEVRKRADQRQGKGKASWFKSDAFTFFQHLCDSFNSRLPPGSEPTVFCYDPAYKDHLKNSRDGGSNQFSPAESLRRYQYPKVAKNRKQWLLDGKMIFLPTHVNGNHWILVVIEQQTIDLPSFSICYLDSQKAGKESDADMNTRRDDILDPIIQWFNDELRFQREEDGDQGGEAISWRKKENDSCFQQNTSDCGVFVCTNAILCLYGLPKECIDGKNMDTQRLKIASTLLYPKYLEYTMQMPQGY